MGITALRVTGCYHIGCHGLTEAAWTGDTDKIIIGINLFIKNRQDHRLIYIVLICHRSF